MAGVTSRRIVLVAADGLQSLDLTGPLEVLHAASGVVPGAYRIEVAGTAGTAPVRSTSGLALLPDLALADVRGHVDTLLVAGGAGARAAAEDLAVVAAGRRRRPSRASRRSAAPPDARAASRRSAPGPSCSPRPGCSTAAGRRPTGP